MYEFVTMATFTTKTIIKNQWVQLSICILLFILIIVLISTSISKIESTEIGVEYKVVVAELNPNILKEGLNNLTPFSEVIRWPINYQTVEQVLVCNSKDGIKIDLDISFQYIPIKSFIFELTNEYKDFDTYKNIINYVARSSIMHSCSYFSSEAFQKTRSQVRSKIEEDVIRSLYIFKSNVIDLQLRNIDRPERYEDAIAMTENARTDIVLAENERQQKITGANTILTVNIQDANKTLDLANTEATIIQLTAQYESDAILQWYKSKRDILKTIQLENNFSVLNILSYMGNNLFSSKGKLIVSEPSKLNY